MTMLFVECEHGLENQYSYHTTKLFQVPTCSLSHKTC